MACVWIISAVWNTEWRSAAIAGLFLLFAAITASGALLAARRWPLDRRPFARLRTEWDSDQELLRDVTTRQPVAEQRMAARVDA